MPGQNVFSQLSRSGPQGQRGRRRKAGESGSALPQGHQRGDIPPQHGGGPINGARATIPPTHGPSSIFSVSELLSLLADYCLTDDYLLTTSPPRRIIFRCITDQLLRVADIPIAARIIRKSEENSEFHVRPNRLCDELSQITRTAPFVFDVRITPQHRAVVRLKETDPNADDLHPVN